MNRRPTVRVGRGTPGRPAPAQRGMVTAELAFASLGAALAAVLVAWALTLVGLLVRCQDTAAEIARQEARADHSAVARALEDRPDGARVLVRRNGAQVVVRVQLTARPWAGWLPAVPLEASAAVVEEPS
ncbi:TadE family type IV pilus minor pilin [Propionicimonas sp.]|uniref:TadE family type IV pilus minor pilin n=1 Tax=Propionicimonas sp. TaxID=1955623 RepID=UPI0039E3D9AE